jgi:hypothetical protein
VAAAGFSASSLGEAQLPGYALLVDFGLDEAGEISQRILPPQIGVHFDFGR